MLFKKSEPAVTVTEISLKKHYAFMYENFIVSNQGKLFLLLEQIDDVIDGLEFDFFIYKYGYPNDEVSHPLTKYGLGFYGVFKVSNSPWIIELRDNNRQHPRHTDSMFEKYEHYAIKFQDVTVEVICTKMQEVQLTKTELLNFLDEQLSCIVKK